MKPAVSRCVLVGVAALVFCGLASAEGGETQMEIAKLRAKTKVLEAKLARLERRVQIIEKWAGGAGGPFMNRLTLLPPSAREVMMKKVTLRKSMPISSAVREVLAQAGLEYDHQASHANIKGAGRLMAEGPIENERLDVTLAKILAPADLIYSVKGRKVILYRLSRK